MIAASSNYTLGAFGQHEWPVHSADDPASRQQKMLQQRQLVLKRQRDLSKSSFGITAQLNSPFEAAPMQNKAPGWGKMLQVGTDTVACGAEKMPLNDPSGLVCILVPSADEESCPLPSPILSPLQAVHSDITAVLEAALLKSDFGHQESPRTPQQAEMKSCWEVQRQAKFNEKHRERNLLSQTRWGEWKRRHMEADTIVEEMRVSLCPDDTENTRERCSSLKISRVATPWQQCNVSALNESIGIPGTVLEGDVCEQDDELECIESTSACDETERIDRDRDDSVDSGTENTIKEWKSKEQQSPNGKRSRLSRFIPSVHAPKLWRTTKADRGLAKSPVTHTPVKPLAVDLD